MGTRDKYGKYGKLKISISIIQMLLSLFWILLNMAAYIQSQSIWYLNRDVGVGMYTFLLGGVLGLIGFVIAALYLAKKFDFKTNLLSYLAVSIFAVLLLAGAL